MRLAPDIIDRLDNETIRCCHSTCRFAYVFNTLLLFKYIEQKHLGISELFIINALHRYMPNFSKHQSFLSKEAWVSELLAENRIDTTIANANTIGTEVESYSRLPDLFEIVDKNKSYCALMGNKFFNMSPARCISRLLNRTNEFCRCRNLSLQVSKQLANLIIILSRTRLKVLFNYSIINC